MLCKEAEITRATFYLHYNSLTDVLDSILEDSFSENTKTLHDEENLIVHLAKQEDLDAFKKHDYLLPVCQRIAASPKYRVLFQDESLMYYIMKKMYLREKEHIIPILTQGDKLSKDEAEMIFRFMLYGSYAVNKELKWEKSDKWYQFQKMLINFVQGGIKNLLE